MKKYQVLLVLVAISFIVFSCSQPTAPTGTTAPKTEAVNAPAPEAAAPAESTEDVGEVEVVEAPAPEAAAPAPVEGEAVASAADASGDAAPVGEPAIEGGIPKLVVPETVFDFGTMRDTETVTHQFVLRNEGTGILKITNVRASCGCTTTRTEKE